MKRISIQFQFFSKKKSKGMQNEASELIAYSEKYCDSKYEYRHVTLPDVISKKVR